MPIPEIMKVRRHLTIDEELNEYIDELRGLVPFSAYVNDIILKHFDM